MVEFHAATQTMRPTAERKALIAELDLQRSRVAADLDGLGDSLDLNQRFQDSVRHHPGWWIGGGLAAGLVLSRLLISERQPKGRGKKNGIPKRSAFLGLLGIAAKEILRLSTPALKQAASQQLEQWMNDRLAPSPEGRDEAHELTKEKSR